MMSATKQSKTKQNSVLSVRKIRECLPIFYGTEGLFSTLTQVTACVCTYASSHVYLSAYLQGLKQPISMAAPD